MRKILFALLMLLSAAVHAQSYPQPVTPGGYRTTCPAGVAAPCWLPNSQTNPDSMEIIPYRVPYGVGWGGAITQGGSWQQITPANAGRMRFFLQNYCTNVSEGIGNTESIFFIASPTMPTSLTNAIELMACGSYDTSDAVISTGILWVYANTTGHKFMAAEW